MSVKITPRCNISQGHGRRGCLHQSRISFAWLVRSAASAASQDPRCGSGVACAYLIFGREHADLAGSAARARSRDTCLWAFASSDPALLSDGAVAGGETLRRQTGGGVSQVDGLRQFCVRHHAVGEVLKVSWTAGLDGVAFPARGRSLRALSDSSGGRLPFSTSAAAALSARSEAKRSHLQRPEPLPACYSCKVLPARAPALRAGSRRSPPQSQAWNQSHTSASLPA